MKMTGERVNGIKTGYWSSAKKDDLIQKLGPIEANIEKIAEQICDNYCNKSQSEVSQSQLNIICEGCPLTKLLKLVE